MATYKDICGDYEKKIASKVVLIALVRGTITKAMEHCGWPKDKWEFTPMTGFRPSIDVYDMDGFNIRRDGGVRGSMTVTVDGPGAAHRFRIYFDALHVRGGELEYTFTSIDAADEPRIALSTAKVSVKDDDYDSYTGRVADGILDSLGKAIAKL